MGLFDRLRSEDAPRVAFFGIDGVPYSLIEDNPEVFENLHAIANAGDGGEIDSIVPPESSACWPSLTTGVNPGETGVYGFQDREIDSYETYVPMGRDVQAKRLWEYVTEADRKASVFNVPVTFPPERSVQRMVSGFLSPGVEKAAHPESVATHLSESGYRIDANAKLGHREDKTEFIENAHETLERRYEAFDHYVRQDDWDLFFGVFMTTDRINHFLYRDYATRGEYREEFLEFYDTLDDYIGALRETLPDDVTTVVASDHGFTSLEYEVNCNAWLAEEGWLEFEDDPQELGDIDGDSRAYSLIPGRFYLNLEGREPRGSVAEDDYEERRTELVEALSTLEGPDGRPVADRIVDCEEAFRGDHVEIAPDLVVIPTPGFDLKSGFSGGKDVFSTGPRNGMHSFDDATLLIDSPDASVSDADLLDITPTILDLLDVEYKRTAFDGASLV